MNNLGKKLSAIFMDAVTLPYNGLYKPMLEGEDDDLMRTGMFAALALCAFGPLVSTGTLAGVGAVYGLSVISSALKYGLDRKFREKDSLPELMPRTAKAFAKEAPASTPTPKA